MITLLNQKDNKILNIKIIKQELKKEELNEIELTIIIKK